MRPSPEELGVIKNKQSQRSVRCVYGLAFVLPDTDSGVDFALATLGELR